MLVSCHDDDDNDDGREAAVLPVLEAAAMNVDCRVDIELSFGWCYSNGGRRAWAVSCVAAWAECERRGGDGRCVARVY